MPHANTAHKGESVTFRIEPDLKAELTKVAERDQKTLGELLRELARERVALEHHRAFEAEARRQSLAIAERAKDPNSDEAQVLRELEADLEEFADEWR